MSRILLVCVKFSLDPKNPWLTNELAEALRHRGHTVVVLHLDWSGSVQDLRHDQHGAIEIHTLPLPQWAKQLPSSLRKAYHWLRSSWAVSPVAMQQLGDQYFDLLIGFSPAIVTDGLLASLKRRVNRRYFVLWDFFPRYHAELGMLPRSSVVERLLKKAEARAIGRYDVVGCMSPANVKFFNDYHPQYRGVVEVLPLWGAAIHVDKSNRGAIRRRLGISDDEVVCVFGGQLIPGRGIEHIFTLANEVRARLPHVRFLIAGDGSLRKELEQRLAGGGVANIAYLGSLSRQDYLEVLTASDVGLVFNSGRVSVPTFPSKSIDLFRASLPILGIVEEASDYSAIIERIGAGFSATPDRMDYIAESLEKLSKSADLRLECGRNGLEYFQSHMTSDAIAAQLEHNLP